MRDIKHQQYAEGYKGSDMVRAEKLDQKGLKMN